MQLLAFTLESLRADGNISRDVQQKTLQWFSTVYASIFLGGLIYVRPTDPSTPDPDPFVVYLLFGVAEPVLTIAATVVFLGEVVRLGRAALLLRGLESWAAKEPSMHMGTSARVPSLMTESYMAANPLTGGRSRYGVASYYLAILTVFGGALALSLLFSLLFLPTGWSRLSVASSMPTIPMVTAAALLMIWALVTLRLGRRIQQMANRELDLERDRAGWFQAA